jgi:hypothetical protein
LLQDRYSPDKDATDSEQHWWRAAAYHFASFDLSALACKILVVKEQSYVWDYVYYFVDFLLEFLLPVLLG